MIRKSHSPSPADQFAADVELRRGLALGASRGLVMLTARMELAGGEEEEITFGLLPDEARQFAADVLAAVEKAEAAA